MGDKCARCGGDLHWYNEKQDNPVGEGQICEECIKKDRAKKKEEKEAGEGYFSSKHIISNIEKFRYFTELKYILIDDFSTKGTYFSLIKAINLLAEIGWRCVNITNGPEEANLFPTIYALMEKVD